MGGQPVEPGPTGDLSSELTAGLSRLAAGQSEVRLGRETTALIERYRADRPAQADVPIVASPSAARAYLLYRMPATFAAVRAVLAQLPDRVAAPVDHLDLGGGSGAACWAAADRWPSLTRQTVVDNAAEMLAVGRELGRGSSRLSLREVHWSRRPLTSGAKGAEGGEVGEVAETADLVTVSYVLSELTEDQRERVVQDAANAARRLLVLVEPGTTAGHRRILAARASLLASADWHLVAPCPHTSACPMTGTDWCHFPARVNRSAIHRKLKQADRGFEDEKFSYLVLSRDPVPPAENRVVRRPRIAKGRVDLTLCTHDAALETVTVAKSNRPHYRPARDLTWGDPWPPPDEPVEGQ